MSELTDQLAELFSGDGFTAESLFVKALTENDDSGRHGVLVPKECYPLFPPLARLEGEPGNPQVPVITSWWASGHWHTQNSKWILYPRYPERRLSSLNPRQLNVDGPRLLAVAKNQQDYTYRCVVARPDDAFVWRMLLRFLELDEFRSGAYRVTSIGAADAGLDSDETELVDRLHVISRMGYLPTRLAGDPGVGITLEVALGLSPNSLREADFRGIEIKAMRANEGRTGRRVSLFSRTPDWRGISAAELTAKYGYQDSDGYQALRTSVYGHRESAAGWQLLILRDEGRLWAFKNGEPVVSWPSARIEAGLSKHKRAAIIQATSEGTGTNERFWYRRVTLARDPSLERFLRLVEDGGVCLDFTLHLTSSGRARDHGYLFRIHEPYFAALYTSMHTVELGQ